MALFRVLENGAPKALKDNVLFCTGCYLTKQDQKKTFLGTSGALQLVKLQELQLYHSYW